MTSGFAATPPNWVSTSKSFTRTSKARSSTNSTRPTTRASTRRCSTRRRSAAAIRRWSRRSRQVKLSDDRGPHLEPDPARPGLADGGGQPGRRRRVRPAGLLPGVARRARLARGEEMIRAAIVGLGRWGRTLVGAVQGKSTEFRFTAGHSRTGATAEPFCAEHGIAYCDDLDRILADPGDRRGRLRDAAQPARRAGRAHRRRRQARLYGKAVHPRRGERGAGARCGGARRG